jgi:hypothetical protein
MKPIRRDWMTHPWTAPIAGSLLPVVIVGVFGLMGFLANWEAGGPWRALRFAAQFASTPAIVAAYALPILGLLGLGLLLRWGSIPAHIEAAERPVLWFECLDFPHPRVPLTRRQLRKFLLITGRPGSGKTTAAGALLAALLRETAADGRADGRPFHTVVFDVHRSLAAPIAALSRELGRRAVVIDLGHPEAALGLVLPRPGPYGVEALVESVRRSWFSFQGEIPTQMRDTLKNAFALLDAGDYGLDQALRVLLSPRFRDHLLAQNPARLPPHLPDWLTLIGSMPPGEQRSKFLSTFARLFMLLESPALRLALAGRGHGGFNLETLVDPGYAGPGIDLIVTAQGQVAGELIYFFFGLVLNELSAVLRQRLSSGRASWAPEVAVFIDEMGRYGSPEAMLEFVAASRNVGVTVAGIVHSVALLDPHLQQQVLVSAANRIAGGEAGPGAEATAGQLFAYVPDPAKDRTIGGQAGTSWSATDQLAAFLSRLRHLPDREFVVRFDGWQQALWARPLLGYGRRPVDARIAAWLARRMNPGANLGRWLGRVADSGGPAAPLLPELAAETLEDTLFQAAVASGRPLAEFEAELAAENARLDRLCGAVAYEPVVRAAAGDEGWRTRADDDFAPF